MFVSKFEPNLLCYSKSLSLVLHVHFNSRASVFHPSVCEVTPNCERHGNIGTLLHPVIMHVLLPQAWLYDIYAYF